VRLHAGLRRIVLGLDLRLRGPDAPAPLPWPNPEDDRPWEERFAESAAAGEFVERWGQIAAVTVVAAGVWTYMLDGPWWGFLGALLFWIGAAVLLRVYELLAHRWFRLVRWARTGSDSEARS
jgi:hypothetical protein